MALVFDESKKIHEQINEHNWCKMKLFRRSNYTDDIHSACTIGWLQLKMPNDVLARVYIERKLLEDLDVDNMATWNDAPERTVDDVRNLFKKHDL